MKSKFRLFSLLLLGSITLSSCSLFGPKVDPKKDDEEDKPITEEPYNGYQDTKTATKPTSGIGSFKIYATNDFHGAVEETNSYIGLAKLATFMKQKTSEENTMFIDSGDAFQGSLLSNYRRGKLVIDCFNEANLTAMSLGNHDFDWSLDVVKENKKYAKFPMLCANICDYTWDTKKRGTTHQDDIGYSYSTKVLDNGLKVGIIGTIGEQQITSISSNFMREVYFADQAKYIQNISDYLRSEKKCDVIIASSHSSYDQMDPYSVTKVSTKTNKPYVDLVLNGHSHDEEIRTSNDIYCCQFGSHGESVGQIEMYYDFANNKVVYSDTNVRTLSKSTVSSLVPTVDTKIGQICAKYENEVTDISNQVLNRNFSGSFYSSEQLPDLMAEAIYKVCLKQGIQLDFTLVNYARASYYSNSHGGVVTYSDIFNCFPFDNEVHIIEISGSKATASAKRNFHYSETITSLNNVTTYKVACLDYLAWHTDENRTYDYFPNATLKEVVKKDGVSYTYREMLKDYLLDNPDKTFKAGDYTTSNLRFSF